MNLPRRNFPSKDSNFLKGDDNVEQETRHRDDVNEISDGNDGGDILFEMFSDPDPNETFNVEFFHPREQKEKEKQKQKEDDEEEDYDEGENEQQQEQGQTQLINERISIVLKGQKEENGQLLSSTGLTLWPASKILCQYLVNNNDLVRDKHILELGAGLGLCGVVALKLHAQYVYLTDGDIDVLTNLRSNVKLNGYDDTDVGSNVSCSQLIWGNQIQYPTSTIDVILGADIIYVEEVLPSLWETISSILPSDGKFILGYTPRNVSIDLVFQYATEYKFSWTSNLSSTGDNASCGIYIFTRE